VLWETPQQASRRAQWIAEDLRARQVQEVLARMQKLRPKTPEHQEARRTYVRSYNVTAARMRYEEYLSLGLGIGSAAVESAPRQVVNSRTRQAGRAGRKRERAHFWPCAYCCSTKTGNCRTSSRWILSPRSHSA
jgi:hypothetical protein